MEGMRVPGTPIERAVRLPWLAPGAPALVALATAENPLQHSAVRSDPAAITLLFRFVGDAEFASPPTFSSIDRARLLAFARKRRDQKAPQVDPPSALVQRVLHFAKTSRRVADATSPILAEAAYFSACLASVGMLALADEKMPPSKCLAVSRRLLRKWKIPASYALIVSTIEQSPVIAGRLGAEPRLVAILRAAAWILLDSGEASPIGDVGSSALHDAGLNLESARSLVASKFGSQRTASETTADLLPELLRTAERASRRSATEEVERLEREVDQLQSVLRDQQRDEDARLQERKLSALAEFSAGAGHEINTPLAVISGQAQYLMSRDNDDPIRRKALQTIVQQTRRVHDILTDLMQFARPATPNLQVLDLGLIVREAVGQCFDAATDRGIKIEVDMPETFLSYCDAKQVRTALHCLLRNAIDAVPDGGWVRAVGTPTLSRQLSVAIEDSGSGPDPDYREHLFDPFFSGRPAGRGRGLGLSTAWRLAHEQGGDLQFQPSAVCPSRFVLTLPRAEAMPDAERMTA